LVYHSRLDRFFYLIVIIQSFTTPISGPKFQHVSIKDGIDDNVSTSTSIVDISGSTLQGMDNHRYVFLDDSIMKVNINDNSTIYLDYNSIEGKMAQAFYKQYKPYSKHIEHGLSPSIAIYLD
jgi:hypothetical protein